MESFWGFQNQGSDNFICFVLFSFFLADAKVQYGSRRGTAPKERKKKKKGQQSQLTSAAFWTLAKRHDKRPPQVTCGTCLTLSVCPAAWPESTWSCQHCFKPTHPLRKAKPLVVVGEKWLRSADVGPPWLTPVVYTRGSMTRTIVRQTGGPRVGGSTKLSELTWRWGCGRGLGGTLHTPIELVIGADIV